MIFFGTEIRVDKSTPFVGCPVVECRGTGGPNCSGKEFFVEPDTSTESMRRGKHVDKYVWTN